MSTRYALQLAMVNAIQQRDELAHELLVKPWLTNEVKDLDPSQIFGGFAIVCHELEQERFLAAMKLLRGRMLSWEFQAWQSENGKAWRKWVPS